MRDKSIQWPHIQLQRVFYGYWRHNYYCQQRQAGRPGQWAVYFFRCETHQLVFNSSLYTFCYSPIEKHSNLSGLNRFKLVFRNQSSRGTVPVQAAWAGTLEAELSGDGHEEEARALDEGGQDGGKDRHQHVRRFRKSGLTRFLLKSYRETRCCYF